MRLKTEIEGKKDKEREEGFIKTSFSWRHCSFHEYRGTHSFKNSRTFMTYKFREKMNETTDGASASKVRERVGGQTGWKLLSEAQETNEAKVLRNYVNEIRTDYSRILKKEKL